MSDRICTYCGQEGHRAHACPLRPCMGGWCGSRESCPAYHSPAAAVDPAPAENLCRERAEREPDDWPITRRMVPVGQWERRHAGMLRRAEVFDGLGAAA